MRVISQLCLKMCQQPARWTQPASFLAPQTIYIHPPPTEMQMQRVFLGMVSHAKTCNMCLIIKANECSTSASKPLAWLLQDAFTSFSPISHLYNSPPQPFSLRKACQRKSSQVEDIVERLWQAESHSNGSIMSLIMVWVSIIYQGWGPSETKGVEENDDSSAGWQAMMSPHSQWYNKAGAEGGRAPSLPVSLRAEPWGLSHGQTCSSWSAGLENRTWLVASTGPRLAQRRPCLLWNRELGDLTLPREYM